MDVRQIIPTYILLEDYKRITQKEMEYRIWEERYREKTKQELGERLDRAKLENYKGLKVDLLA